MKFILSEIKKNDRTIPMLYGKFEVELPDKKELSLYCQAIFSMPDNDDTLQLSFRTPSNKLLTFNRLTVGHNYETLAKRHSKTMWRKGIQITKTFVVVKYFHLTCFEYGYKLDKLTIHKDQFNADNWVINSPQGESLAQFSKFNEAIKYAKFLETIHNWEVYDVRGFEQAIHKYTTYKVDRTITIMNGLGDTFKLGHTLIQPYALPTYNAIKRLSNALCAQRTMGQEITSEQLTELKHLVKLYKELK